MGVFLNRTFDDGSVTALWRITESEGKSLSEQRLAVNALIDSVFEGKYRLCHDDEGIPVLETVSVAKTAHRRAGANRVHKSAEPTVPFVSVSHTRGWVAVMTHPKNRVGIDIELAGRNFSAVAKKALSDSELEHVDSWAEVLKNSLLPDTDTDPSETTSTLNARNTVLGLVWCAKEAVYKRLTVPATDFAEQIEIEDIGLVPNSTNPPRETWLGDPTAPPESHTIEGKITAIFKHENGCATRIRLSHLLLPELILVHTID